MMLAKLHRAGELISVWVPDAAHEAMRDLVRARATASRMLTKCRQHLQAFPAQAWPDLQRQEHPDPGLAALAHHDPLRLSHPADRSAGLYHAVEDAQARVVGLTRQIEELTPSWSLAPLVRAFQAMRGVAFIVAVTIVAEVGDFTRFANPRQLMAYLGPVPSEPSSGSSVRRGGLTKTGNVLARRALIEAAWTYRMPARISRTLHDRIEAQPKAVRDAAWKAQVRLCARVPATARKRQGQGRGGRRNRPRARRLPLDYRPAGADRVRAVSDQHGAQGWRRGTLGEPSC
jgi:transposase